MSDSVRAIQGTGSVIPQQAQAKEINKPELKNILEQGLKSDQKQVVDSLLDKISTKGTSKLTSQEADFLKGVIGKVIENNPNISSKQKNTLSSVLTSLNKEEPVIEEKNKDSLNKVFNGIAQGALKIGRSITDTFKNIFSGFKANSGTKDNASRVKQVEEAPEEPKRFSFPKRTATPPATTSLSNPQPAQTVVAPKTNKPQVAIETPAAKGQSKSASASETSKVDTSKMNEEQKFDFYSNLMQKNGGKVNLTPGAKNIVSLRTPTDPGANGGKGVYDDKTALIWVDKNGKKHAQEFISNVDPSAQFAGGRFRSDSGRIKAGSYQYKISERADRQGKLESVGEVKVDRFQGGKFVSTNNTKGDFLFHGGGELGDNTLSAGCQTMPPKEWAKFWAAVNSDGNPGNINYTVINTK